MQRDCEPAPLSPPPAFKLANRASRVCPACTAGAFYSVSIMNTRPGTSIPESTRNAFDWLGRNSYVVSILDQHVKAEAHKTMVRHRMLRDNPYLPDGAGNGSE